MFVRLLQILMLPLAMASSLTLKQPDSPLLHRLRNLRMSGDDDDDLKHIVSVPYEERCYLYSILWLVNVVLPCEERCYLYIVVGEHITMWKG